MLHTSRFWIRIFIATTLVISSILFSPPAPVFAHSPTPTFGQPYYGAPLSVSRRFGGGHNGIDFVLRWQAVLAAAAGTVELSAWYDSRCHDETQTGCASYTGYGLHIRINHGGYTTFYGHLSVARKGGTVQKGEWIGVSGDSGNSASDGDPYGPHLHFEVRHDGVAVNPDNEGGVNLWNDGEWAGANPTVSVPAWRYPTLPNYGTTVFVDDNETSQWPFQKGRASTVICPPDVDCWKWGRVPSGGYSGGDGRYWYTVDNNTTEDYWAKWRPSLSSFTNYTVWAFIPCSSYTQYDTGASWQAPYTIYYSGGSRPIQMDQLTLTQQGDDSYKACSDRWFALGTYPASGTNLSVRVTDKTWEITPTLGSPTQPARKILVDAFKFVLTNVGPFEAENYRSLVGPLSNHWWELRTSQAGYRGSGYMEVVPNATEPTGIDSNWVNTSPQVQYRVVVPTTGTYHVWVRGYDNDPNDDSVHAGLDGEGPISAAHIGYYTCWQNDAWRWCKLKMDQSPATLTINTPGVHTIHLWMREDGFKVDQVLLTLDSNYTPQ